MGNTSTYYSQKNFSQPVSLSATVGTSLTSLSQTGVTSSEGAILGLTDLYNKIQLEIKNTSGSVILNGISFEVKAHENADWVAIATSTSSTTGFIEATTGETSNLGTGATAIVRLNIGNCYAFRLRASVASSTAAVTAKGYVWKG